jgi:hypothetical protein
LSVFSYQLSEATISDLVALAGFSVALTAGYGAWHFWKRRIIATSLAALGVVALLVGIIGFWYAHRPLPSAGQWTLFPGIEYIREVISTPRPMVNHIVSIDLTSSGLSFLVTPGVGSLPACTTSQFVDEFDLQLGINGDFFDPWRDYGIWDYYPHVGDPVNLRGLTISNGDLVTEGYVPQDSFDTIYFSADNRVLFEKPKDTLNAISGNLMLVRDGIPIRTAGNNAYLNSVHPRTAVAVNKAGDKLLFVLVDGRQPRYSEGATIADMVEIVLRHGAYTALNLDGGGSTTLVIENKYGEAIVLNSPIHNRIPGRERPIANHLGVFVSQP